MISLDDWGAGGVDNFAFGGGGSGRGRGRGGLPMDSRFGQGPPADHAVTVPDAFGSGRGRGRGGPSMDSGFDQGPPADHGYAPVTESAFGRGSIGRGRGRGGPPMDLAQNGFVGDGHAPVLENAFGRGGSGRGRGGPSMDSGFDQGPPAEHGYAPVTESAFGSGRGRGRGGPPMDSGFDQGPPADNGYAPVTESAFGSGGIGRGRGRGGPPMDSGVDQGPPADNGYAPVTESAFGSGRGRGRGGPPMDSGFDQGPPADNGYASKMEQRERAAHEIPHIPTKRAIEEIFEEDVRVKDKYVNIREEDENVTVTGPYADKYQEFERWSDFEFEPALLANIEKANYTFPRKIQSLTFPLIKGGHDLKGHAETGSGKSAAFLLPIIDAVMKNKKLGQYTSRRCCPFALILEPTRELTVQVYDQARKLTVDCDVSVSRAYGMYLRHANLRQISTDGCDILIGTPGRICDFFHAKNLLCDNLKVLVFDEADQLLEDSFQANLRQLNVVTNWPKIEERQTLLFSATFPVVVQKWADEWMRNDSMMVSNKRLVGANSRIKQKFLLTNNASKKDTLLRLFQLELEEAKKRDPVNGKIRNTMVFVNSKRDADVVSTYLNQFGFETTTINGNRPQEMREKALSDFRAGRYQIVVTTDVCARGHDIKDLDHVINLDLPPSGGEGIEESYTTYVHRIGRTGRLQEGSATTFFDATADIAMAQGIVKGLQETEREAPEWLHKLCTEGFAGGMGEVTDADLLDVLK